MKFRKRPVVIDAEQLVPGMPTPEGVSFGYPVAENESHPLSGKHWISTLEGNMIAEYGDWIITGIKGERYPCKPDIFEKTYERVDE